MPNDIRHIVWWLLWSLLPGRGRRLVVPTSPPVSCVDDPTLRLPRVVLLCAPHGMVVIR
ncbi:hypothetical protein [Streptomyces sp. NPDC021212]|uniref:hypothetical protein n=1 Tax=Streptomyces sp. NPDC021212 TaxID=3365118 RepID=UPI00379F748A